MNRPPLVIKVNVDNEDGKFKVWFPLFLLWPFLLVLLLLLLPFLLLAALLLWGFGWGKPLLMLIPVLLGIIWEMRGLEVDVDSPEETVFVSIK